MQWRMLFFVFFFGWSTSYAQEIPNEAELLKLAGKPLNPNLKAVQSVKYVYELDRKTVQFVPSQLYTFHYEYCLNVLNFRGSVGLFNDLNYRNVSGREYLLGNINKHERLGWFIDLSVLDHQTAEQLVTVHHQLKKQLPFLDTLSLLLNSAELIQMKASLEGKIPLILPADFYANQTLQIISQGKANGKLYVVDEAHPMEKATSVDILVLRDLPNELPNVRGVIMEQFTTPLSHISLLAQNRKIPVVADKNWKKELEKWQHGDWIQLTVNSEKYWTKAGKELTATTHRKPIKLEKNTTFKRLAEADELECLGPTIVGNKATNFGRLVQLQGMYKVPEAAFCIPIAYFDAHLKSAKVSNEISLLSTLTEPKQIDSVLKVIRKKIKNTSVDQHLLAEITARLRASGFTSFRFRSSTNAEDTEGFNGAGLYDSETAILNDSNQTVERALQKVWASCYSDRAYNERHIFNMDESTVGMGILVHRSFPTEGANGVVLTINRYRFGYPGISVNVQVGDVPVVNPPEGVQCDELIVMGKSPYTEFEEAIEYVNFSNLNNGQPVCSETELFALEQAVRQIKDYYWEKVVKRSNYSNVEELILDLEFKFDGPNRQLYIKQVRTF